MSNDLFLPRNGRDTLESRDEATVSGDFPPVPGVRWIVDAQRSGATVTLRHRVYGSRRHELKVTGGTLRASNDDEIVMTLRMACAMPRRGSRGNVDVVFRSVDVRRTEPFRLLLEGDVQVGGRSQHAFVHTHDLSWIAGRAPAVRILTFSTELDRMRWDPRLRMESGRLLATEAEVFIHTEWFAETGLEPAA